MVGAARRVGAQDQVLLDVARDGLTQPITEPGLVGNVIAGAGRSDDAVLEPLRMFAAAIDQLRVDAGLKPRKIEIGGAPVNDRLSAPNDADRHAA
jgi:hypothetical protein